MGLELKLKIVNIEYIINDAHYVIPTRIYPKETFVAMDYDGFIYTYSKEPDLNVDEYEVSTLNSQNTLLAIYDNSKINKPSKVFKISAETNSIALEYV